MYQVPCKRCGRHGNVSSQKEKQSTAKPWHEIEYAKFQLKHHYISTTQFHPLVSRYDSFGRLTNVTFPTGQVSSFRSDTDSSVHVQVETSSKDDVTITTNLSASGAFYTLLQGKSGGGQGTLRQRGGKTPLEEDGTRNRLLLELSKNRKALQLSVLSPNLQNIPA